MEKKDHNTAASIIFSQVKRSFHAICLNLLSLLLPLSYLLLARLTSPPPSSFTFNSIILYVLISFLSVSSFLSSLTGHTLHIKLPNCIAWACLCLFQACIFFGIEATIRSGFQPLESISGPPRGMWLKRTLLFVGIYEQMMLWKTELVKPLVDDTIYEGGTEEGGIETFLMGLSFSGLWLWLLQREIEPLVLASGRGGLRNGGGSNFFLWLLTFATLITGFVRTVEFLICQIGILLQLMYGSVEQEADGLTPVDIEV